MGRRREADAPISGSSGVFSNVTGHWIHSPHDSWANGFIPDKAARTNQSGEVTGRCIATEIGAPVAGRPYVQTFRYKRRETRTTYAFTPVCEP